MQKICKDKLATILGILTSLCTAYAVIDIDSLNFNLFNTYFKLFIIGVPAVTGYFSTIKSKKK